MNKVSVNWKEFYKEKMDKLSRRCSKLYDENQKMKRRLIKYEISRQMVNYWNKHENNNTRTTGNGENDNTIESSGRVYPTRD